MSVGEESLDAGTDMLAQVRILVVGPLWLERYIFGELAGSGGAAPVLRPGQRFERASGAGNVALGIAALGCQAFLCGFWGLDAEQEMLATLLDAGRVDLTGVVSAAQGTRSRTGFFAGERPLLWLDMEAAGTTVPEDAMRLEARAVELVAKVHAVVLADEAAGADMLSAELCGAIMRAARTAGVPVVARMAGADLGRFSGAAAVLVDQAGLAQATGSGADEAAVRGLLVEHELQHVVVMGEGLTVLGAAESMQLPAAGGIGEGTGASDALLAMLAVATAEGQTPSAAAGRAWAAAQQVARRFGRAPLTRNDGMSS